MENKTDIRFGGIQRLYGKQGFAKLQKSHVLVVGLGGVGSWTVESLARSGVKEFTLVDFDDICVSNTNRQLHALQGNIGRMKTQALKERLLKINPQIKVHSIELAYGLDTESEIFANQFDVAVDAIDRSLTKFHFAVACRERNVPLVVAGSAGGLSDPSLIKTLDLSKVYEDKLLAILRKDLRRQAGFPRSGAMGIRCVFSNQKPIYVDEQGDLIIEKPASYKRPLDCSTGLGTVTHMTGTFGFMLSHLAIQALLA